MKKIWQDEDYKLKPLTEKLLEKAERRDCFIFWRIRIC